MDIPNLSEYSSSLKKKILELRELIEANIVESAEHQQLSHYNSVAGEKLKVGQEILLNNVTKGKLDPRWTGQGSSTVLLRISTMVRAVHINHVRPFLTEVTDQTESTNWTPPIPSQSDGSDKVHELDPPYSITKRVQ